MNRVNLSAVSASFFLAGCTMGLTALPEPAGSPLGASEADDGLPATQAVLTGSVFSIAPESLHITEPPGLDALAERVIAQAILVYVAGESESALHLDVALAGADGEQDPCEAVRPFPTADWSQNPVFDAGPGEIETSFGGQPAAMRQTDFGGVFLEDGSGWTDGTLTTQLDGRELAGALGKDVDVCALVEDLGGACEPCADGANLCFPVAMGGLVATAVDIAFDPAPSAEGCSK